MALYRIDSNKKEYTSNIARFTAFIYDGEKDPNTKLPIDVTLSDDPDNADDAAALYELINTKTRYEGIEGYSGNEDHSKTFLTLKGDDENLTLDKKTTSITLTVPYTADDWYEVKLSENTTQKYLNVYLYITYDVKLIDYYFKAFDDALLNNLDYEGIPFANDLKKISVSYDKNDG